MESPVHAPTTFAALTERAAKAEGERDGLQEALRVSEAGRHNAEVRAKAAEDRATGVVGAVKQIASALEQFQQDRTQAMEPVLARAVEAERRAADAEAEAMVARQRVADTEARLRDLEQRPVEAADPANAAAMAFAAEAARQAQERADEADRRAAVATERLDRFQQDRIAQARAAAARAVEVAEVTNLEAAGRRPWWRRLVGQRGGNR